MPNLKGRDWSKIFATDDLYFPIPSLRRDEHMVVHGTPKPPSRSAHDLIG